ncbi:MAG: AMP-binding protein [Sulfurimicrobium sp.]|nr:AMP-binding protein [Sulfurimicrobium sp.]
MAKSYCHRGGETPLLGATIPEHFAAVARRFAEREAVVSLHQNRRLSYSELSLAVDRLAYALQRSEVQCLFVTPSFRSSDYVAMLLELMPELDQEAKAGLACAEFPQLRCVVLYDPVNPNDTARPHAGFTVWQEVLAAAHGVRPEKLEEISAALDIDDPINIQYTSGTTGFPKAVVLTHHNILNNAWFTAQAMHFTEVDRLCVPVPFYHCFGMVLANLLCLSVGACEVIASDHFDPLAVLQAVEQERCTAIHGVPTMFIAELEHPRFAEFDLTSLRTGIMAGAPCPPPLMRRVMGEMHCSEILIGYGETEASPLTHLTSRDDSFERRIETVGTNLPHQEVKVVRMDSGLTVVTGEVGEICFRGHHVMKGYYGDPEATRKTIDANGWLHSGDLGTMNEDGYVRITGRLKEMIIRGGENIYPREIEEFLFTHPKVAQVAVFGIPDDFYGEEIMAWVQLRAGQSASDEELREFCRGSIAHFKIPRWIWFVEEFPTTVTGKLQKFRMREIALEKMGQGGAGRT